MQTLLGTVHHLINAVNGLDPAMPPVQALIALNKIKAQVEGSAQGAGGKPPTVASQDVSGILSAINNAMPKKAVTPMPAPTVAAAPEEATEEQTMAHGGIAHLPANFHFDHGGIIAFKEGTGDKGVEDPTPEEIAAAKKPFIGGANIGAPGAGKPRPTYDDSAFLDQLKSGISNFLFPSYDVDAPAATPTQPVAQPTAQAASQVAPQVNPQPQANLRLQANPQLAAPSRPQPSANQQGLGSLTPPPMGPGQQALLAQLSPDQTKHSTFEEDWANYTDKNPELKQPAGSVLEKHLQELSANDEQSKRDREKREAARNLSSFFSNLARAGQMSAGRTGIGALLGNYGLAASKTADDAFARQEAYEQADRTHAIEMVKYQAELESARRAEKMNMFKEAQEHKQKAEEIMQKMNETKTQAASALARDETSTQNELMNRASQERIAAQNRQTQMDVHNLPGAEQKMANQYIASYQAKHPGASFAEGYDAFRGGEKTDVSALKEIINSLNAPKEKKDAAFEQLAKIGGISSGPQVGTTRQYQGKTYTFMGGDPNSQASWKAN